MNLYSGADTDAPGPAAPAGTQLICIYVGEPGTGAPDTPHIWTIDEANAYFDVDSQVRFLPTYVHNYADGDPYADADNGCNAIEAMGWAAHMPGPENRILFVDCEVTVASEYFWQVQTRINERGFTPVLYGSPYYVRQNKAMYGYWEAVPTNHRPSVLTGNTWGVQWSWGPEWDRSVFVPRIWTGAGEGRRHTR